MLEKSTTARSTLTTKNLAKDKKNGKKYDRPWCEHCKHPWHARETCWKFHRKSFNAKKKGEGLQATYNQGPQTFLYCISTHLRTSVQTKELFIWDITVSKSLV